MRTIQHKNMVLFFKQFLDLEDGRKNFASQNRVLPRDRVLEREYCIQSLEINYVKTHLIL